MQIHFKRIAMAAALGALAISISSSAFAQAKTKVEWWYANGGRIEEAIQKMITDFNASQDKYEVVGTRKGNYEETFAAMIAAYRAGQQPTLVQATERSFLTMLNSDAVVPVNKLMADQGYETDWGDFLKPVADFYMVDGEPVALPFNSSTAILWYNADKFKAAGFDKPADTWQGLDEQLHAMKDQGVTECGMVLNSDYPWSMIEGYSSVNDYPYGTKGNGFDGMDTEYVFNTTPVVGQVERIKQWIDDGVIQLAGQGLNPTQLFTSGSCATWASSTAGHATVEADAQFGWGATFMPHEEGVEPHNSNIGGAALWVLKGQSDEQYAATAAFINYVAQPETQAWWSKTTGYVPITNAAYKLMQDDGFFKEHPTREIAIQQLEQGTPTENSRGFRFGNGNQSYALLVEELQAVWTGQKTAQDALDSAATRGNKILRQYEQLNGSR